MVDKKKAINLKFTVSGIDEYDAALQDVNDCFHAFREAANNLQGASDRLNNIEIKISYEEII